MCLTVRERQAFNIQRSVATKVFYFQNSSINIIQQEWFKASSHKLSNPSMVEDYLSCFNEISPSLLENIVNMADANV